MNEIKQIKGILKDLIDLASDYISEHSPSANKFLLEKREPTLTDYQHSEYVVERLIYRDRKHPLPTVLINNFNDKTGNDLGEVNIVYGTGANEYTRSRHALALVVLDTIYFRNGAYRPETEEGRKTIAHELTHVAQHKNKEKLRNMTREELEQEAEINEFNEKYNSDPLILKTIDGKKYKFKRAVWKKIVSNAIHGLEQYIEDEEEQMPKEEYLELLLKYEKFKEEDMWMWEI